MALGFESESLRWKSSERAFSLIELLTSVLIITVLMGAVFTFMFQAQKKLQGTLVVSESNQTARAAMELMTQEIGQSGFNPQFVNVKTVNQNVNASASSQCITLTDITGINPGDWVEVDTGANYEIVQVLATSNGALSGSTPCSGSKQILARFLANHPGTPAFPIASYKFSYPTGILQGATVSWGGTNVTVSNDHMLAFYGDINNDGTIYYVVYSLYNPTTASPPQVTIPVGGTPTTFYLYSLYRSITPVTFNSSGLNTNNKASPLVENVIYKDITTANPVGPTGQPIFAYPNPVSVALIPNTVSVVGTIVSNLCVAVNPKAIETGSTVQWYTMASQVRPLNLWSAVTVSQAGGARYLPQTPIGLPMSFPSTLSNYYF